MAEMNQTKAKPVETRELRAPAVPAAIDRDMLTAETGVGKVTCQGGKCVLSQTSPA